MTISLLSDDLLETLGFTGPSYSSKDYAKIESFVEKCEFCRFVAYVPLAEDDIRTVEAAMRLVLDPRADPSITGELVERMSAAVHSAQTSRWKFAQLFPFVEGKPSGKLVHAAEDLYEAGQKAGDILGTWNVLEHIFFKRAKCPDGRRGIAVRPNRKSADGGLWCTVIAAAYFISALQHIFDVPKTGFQWVIGELEGSVMTGAFFMAPGREPALHECQTWIEEQSAQAADWPE